MLAAALQRLVDRIDPQEGRYRMLFESSPLPMWVFDAETLRFLAANEAAIRLYSYSRQEFLSMMVEDICRAEDREAFRQFLRRESGSVNRGVFRHVKSGGEPIDIEGVGYLVSWRGRAARLVLINDITERLRTQHALEFSQERLRALSRRLLEVQEQERRRLARDLHDDVGQALTALKIQLESRSRVEECVETVSHTLERVRQLSLSLRPPQLDDLGLGAALRSHLDRQAALASLAPHFEAPETPREIPAHVETAAFASRRKRSTTWCGTPARAICGCACSPAARGSSSRCAMTAAASMSRRRGGARRRVRASGSPAWKSASRWRAAPSSCARRPDKAPYCWHHSRSSRERNHKPPDVVVAHPGRTRR